MCTTLRSHLAASLMRLSLPLVSNIGRIPTSTHKKSLTCCQLLFWLYTRMYEAFWLPAGSIPFITGSTAIAAPQRIGRSSNPSLNRVVTERLNHKEIISMRNIPTLAYLVIFIDVFFSVLCEGCKTPGGCLCVLRSQA